MKPEEIAQEIADYAEKQADGTVLFTRLNGEKITVRELKVRDQMAVKDIKDLTTQALTLVANVTDLTPKDLEDWPLRDFNRIEKVIAYFFG